ncbi:lipoprotein [Paucisalibacillus globulus]|uniref:lipoprotein n=1 Tax=Paucisalibacillus globulus TaxID=351095 RepID=UPI000BB91A84|nr:hypothetical protein [Paucisalibacillus globulus]
MKRIITLLLSILLLAACSETTNNNYIFTGESEHWEAEYVYEGIEKWGEKDGQRTYSNNDSYKFVLTYKGSLEELSSIKKLEYSFETRSGSSDSTMEFTEPPSTVMFSSSGGSTGAKVSENEIIKVNVKWDDFEETFELQTK